MIFCIKNKNKIGNYMEEAKKAAITPCKTEQELIEHFGYCAFEKQFDLDNLIDDNNWQLDIEKGIIYFGNTTSFPIQILGSFSSLSETWLWAWSNEKSELFDHNIQHALQLQKYGEENNITLLKHSQFKASENDLHLIGLIAVGMLNASAYYIANHSQGAVAVIINSDKLDNITQKNSNHNRMLTTFPIFISIFDMNHHAALTHYLNSKDYQITQETFDDRIKLIATKDKNQLIAEFDNNSRLITLNG